MKSLMRLHRHTLAKFVHGSKVQACHKGSGRILQARDHLAPRVDQHGMAIAGAPGPVLTALVCPQHIAPGLHRRRPQQQRPVRSPGHCSKSGGIHNQVRPRLGQPLGKGRKAQVVTDRQPHGQSGKRHSHHLGAGLEDIGLAVTALGIVDLGIKQVQLVIRGQTLPREQPVPVCAPSAPPLHCHPGAESPGHCRQ